MRDQYKVLGLNKDASLEEVKAAYRKLAQQFHPGHNPGSDVSEEMLKMVKNAYQELTTLLQPKSTQENSTILGIDVDVDEVFSNLAKLGFFKYVEEDQMKSVIEGMKYNFQKYRDLDPSRHSMDDPNFGVADKYEDYYWSRHYRQIHADAESLFEYGVCDFLEQLRPFFNKEGVTLTEKTHKVGWGPDEDFYYVTVNGKVYTISDPKNLRVSNNWAYAHKMTIEIVNDLLKSAGSTERAYGYASRNDAGLQILTEELFRYIRTLPLSDYWKPFEANEVKF